MKRRSTTIALVMSVLLAAAGCSKSSDTPGAAASSTPESAAHTTAVTAAPASGVAASPTVPAVGAADTGTSVAAASAVPSTGSPANDITPAAAATAAAVAAPVEAASPEALRKKAQIDWALRQDEIKNDLNGQWAIRAKASSAYNDAKGNKPYSPTQATGAPNIEGFGNSGSAWTPKTPDAGIEWLELEYPKPVQATMVRVRQSYGSGAVMKIELFDEKGAPHTVWSGADPTKGLDYLVAEFPKTAFKTARVKVTLATNVVGGANELDAVQLVGTDK